MRLTTPDTYTYGEVWPHGHYHPSRTLKYKGKEFRLGAGSQDEINVVIDRDNPDVVYVVTRNHSLGYWGVDEYDMTDDEYDANDDRYDPAMSVFEQNDPHNEINLTAYTLVRRTMDRW